MKEEVDEVSFPNDSTNLSPPFGGAETGGQPNEVQRPPASQAVVSAHPPQHAYASGADGGAAGAGGGLPLAPANTTTTLRCDSPPLPSPRQRAQEALGDPPHIWSSGVRLIPEDTTEIKWYPAKQIFDKFESELIVDKSTGEKRKKAEYGLQHEYCTQRLQLQIFGFDAFIRFVCGSVKHEDPKTKKLTDSADHLDNIKADPSNTWHKYVRGTGTFKRTLKEPRPPPVKRKRDTEVPKPPQRLLDEAYYMFLPRKSNTSEKSKMFLEDYLLRTGYCLATYIEIDQGNCAESSATTGPCYLGLWWGVLQSAFCNPDDHRRGTVGIVDKFWNSLKQLKGIVSQSSGGAASQEPVEGAAPLCQCKAREFRGKLDKGIHFLWDLQHHPSVRKAT